MEADISANTSYLNHRSACDFNATSLFVLIGLAIILLSFLICIICVLTYFVYKLRQQTARFMSPLPDERDMIFAFSNKHAELMEYRSNRPASSGSLADPWNTRSEQCDCQMIHKEELNRRYHNPGVDFHTYPKVNVTGIGNKYIQRVFSQPGTLHFRQSQLSLTQEEISTLRKIPKNRMVERLLLESNHQDYTNSIRPI
ncbi:unnamed protein product [Rodentolepis nana]|uniref:Uncharacterized protein n=1 Tax=Rodentolepis nana TaxID=102285 RepID=A0A0R3T548_RODNA|nr:unnamed protein product [Rodentolepis nana]